MATRYEEIFEVLPEIAPCSVAAGSLAKKAFDLMGGYHRTEKDMVSANNIGLIEVGDIESSPLSSRYGPYLTLERSSQSPDIGYLSIVRGRALARVAMLTTLGDGPCNFVAFGDPDTEIGSMEVTRDDSDIDRETRLQLIAGLSDEIDYRNSKLGANASIKDSTDEIDPEGLDSTFGAYLKTRYQEVFGREYDGEEYRLLDTIGDYAGWRFETPVDTKRDLGNGVSYDGTLTYRADIKLPDSDASKSNIIELSVRPDALPDAKFTQIAQFEADLAGTISDVSNLNKIKQLDGDEVRFLRKIINSKNKVKRLPVTFEPIPEDKIPHTNILNRPTTEYGENRVLPPKLQELFDLSVKFSETVKADYANSNRSRFDRSLKRLGPKFQKRFGEAINRVPATPTGGQAKRIQIIHDVAQSYRKDFMEFKGARELICRMIEITEELGAVGEPERSRPGITGFGW